MKEPLTITFGAPARADCRNVRYETGQNYIGTHSSQGLATISVQPGDLTVDGTLVRTLAALLAETGLSEIEYAVGDMGAQFFVVRVGQLVIDHLGQDISFPGKSFQLVKFLQPQHRGFLDQDVFAGLQR